MELTGLNASNGTGNSLANLMIGNSASNLLRGESGDDTYAGGGGNDTITDTGGNDTYQLEYGTGFDTVSDGNGSDVIQLITGMLSTSVVVGECNGSLVLESDYVQPFDRNNDFGRGRGVDGFLISGMVNANGTLNASNAIEQVRFADGTTWTAADLIGRMTRGPLVLNGAASDDLLRGAAGDDTLTGLAVVTP